MRVLVTGITGFVGGHLAEYLLEAGDVPAGISRTGRWPPGLEHLGRLVRCEPCDLTDVAEDDLVALLRRKRPEAIYHLAAQSNPRHGLADPRGTWATNLGGTLNLLEAVRASGLTPRVLLVSSGSCYGNPGPEQIPIAESCPVRPADPYGASKAAADLLGIQHHLTYGTDVVVARPFNLAGPRQSDAFVLSSFARQIAEVEGGRRSRVEVGNLEIVRDFTDVRDVVRAYRLLVEQGRPGEIYHVGTGRGVALATLLAELRALAQIPITIQSDPARHRRSDPPRLVADAAKLRAETGWVPHLPIGQTLAALLEFWRNAPR